MVTSFIVNKTEGENPGIFADFLKILTVPFLISSLNNWADREKFLTSFFERGSGGSSAVLSVANGNALSNLCRSEDRHVFPTCWRDAIHSKKKGKRGFAQIGWGWTLLDDGADTFPLPKVERKLREKSNVQL